MILHITVSQTDSLNKNKQLRFFNRKLTSCKRNGGNITNQIPFQMSLPC
jgi:hypothetical protein